MNREDARIRMRRVGESLLVLGLAVLFFLVLLGLLRVVFPSGPGLQEATQREGLRGAAGLADRSVRSLLLLSEGEEEQELSGDAAAVLVRTINVVKSRRVNAMSWTSAREGQVLQERDAVQTLDQSRAVIRFDAWNTLQMGENSLVIIKRLERDPVRDAPRPLLVMIDGDLRGQFQPPAESEFVEVALPSGVARIADAPDGTAFKLSVNEEQSSTLAIYRGAAELVGQGQHVQVKANQASTMKLDEAPGAAVDLPDLPEPLSPDGNRALAYRDLPPKVRFMWRSARRAEAYRIVVARDVDFMEVVVDERVRGTEFSHGNLRHGTYYWRVSGLDGQREGAPGASKTLTIVRDMTPPVLQVVFPPPVLTPDAYALTGVSEPGAQVFVGGEPVVVAQSGQFESRVTIRPGPNVIVVEAVDEAGNVAYRSEMVNGKF